jgi:hypothetical protein
MALQTSGAIALSNIQSEFGGANPISLSEYYRNGAYVPPGATGIPTSGAIDISDFYGADNQFAFNITSDTANADIRALAIAAGWDEATRLIANVNAGVTLYYGASLAGSFPSGVSLINSGNITGVGGGGGGGAGGTALNITTSDTVDITNNSGAFIAGGGGGGGGSQGGGGAGQSLPGQAGAAGGFYTFSKFLSAFVSPYGCSEGGVMSGTISCTATNASNTRAAGGQQGAYAGSGTGFGGSCTGTGTLTNPYGCPPQSYSAGLTGVGAPNPGGQGGSILSATQNQTISGGGWGLAGADGGGAGGAAISGTYASLTDNGTIYGSV